MQCIEWLSDFCPRFRDLENEQQRLTLICFIAAFTTSSAFCARTVGLWCLYGGIASFASILELTNCVCILTCKPSIPAIAHPKQLSSSVYSILHFFNVAKNQIYDMFYMILRASASTKPTGVINGSTILTKFFPLLLLREHQLMLPR